MTQPKIKENQLDINLNNYALVNSPTLTGNPTAPTPLLSDNSTSIATTEFVKSTFGGTIDAMVIFTGPTIHHSTNVASLTFLGNSGPNSEPVYRITFSTPAVDTNYVIVMSASDENNPLTIIPAGGEYVNLSKTTTYCDVFKGNANSWPFGVILFGLY